MVPARATSASWSLQAGGLSTLTVAGLDASADLDREERDRPGAGSSDADIASALLAAGRASPRVGPDAGPGRHRPLHPAPARDRLGVPETLAARNDFDVYVTSENGRHVRRLRPGRTRSRGRRPPLDLGYGSLGGSANVQVQLVSRAAGDCSRTASAGEAAQQVARSNDGKGSAMGAQSLGGAATVLRDPSRRARPPDPGQGGPGPGRASAFGASMSVTLTAPDMPLVRARRTVRVRGLGPLVSGKWLVKSVRHTVTQAGHTQALALTRNALGDSAAPAGALRRGWPCRGRPARGVAVPGRRAVATGTSASSPASCVTTTTRRALARRCARAVGPAGRPAGACPRCRTPATESAWPASRPSGATSGSSGRTVTSASRRSGPGGAGRSRPATGRRAPGRTSILIVTPGGHRIEISDDRSAITLTASGGASITIGPDGITLDNGQGGTVELARRTVSVNDRALQVS